MKVGLIHTFYTLKGGEDTVVDQELKLLSRHGIHVSLLPFHNPQGSIQQLLYFVLSIFNLGSQTKVRDWIRKEKPDIVHIHNLHFKASPSIIRTIAAEGIPIVFTIHNYRLLCPSSTLFYQGKIFEDSLKGGFPWKAIKNRVYRQSLFQTFWLALIIRFHNSINTWKMVNKYILLSHFAKHLFLESDLGLKDEQLEVKYNFVEDKGFELKNRQSHFLFVGRLTHEKGIELLLQAFENTQHELRIIGDGPLRKMVEEKSSKSSNILYWGPKINSEIIEEMKMCTALVFPSIWYEGMPLTIIEAFSTGTPVIASNIGAMRDMIKDGLSGLHFKVNNPEDLQRKIIVWSKMNENEKNCFSQNARNIFIENYSPENNLQQLLKIYSHLK